MSIRRAPGFTLIEMIIAMVVISVGLAGVLAAFNQVTQSSADPVVHKQMLAIAEEMMEEILLKDFAVNPTGSIPGCDRSNADDVRDYAGFKMDGICTIDGTAITNLSGYKAVVAVDAADATLVPSGGALKVTVTVTHGGESVALTGWRTNY